MKGSFLLSFAFEFLRTGRYLYCQSFTQLERNVNKSQVKRLSTYKIPFHLLFGTQDLQLKHTVYTSRGKKASIYFHLRIPVHWNRM